MGFVSLLFVHTGQGEAALKELVAAGVAHEALAVIGDLGEPAGSAGAEMHVTLDRLGVPGELRGLFMDTIRDGGVVLGVAEDLIGVEEVERVGEKCGALRVVRGVGSVGSHNV